MLLFTALLVEIHGEGTRINPHRAFDGLLAG